MRILWISTWNSDLHSGGVGAYSRGILALLQAAYRDATLVRIEPEAARTPSGHRVRQAVSVLRSVGSPRSAKWHFDHDAGLGPRLRAALESTPADLVVFGGTTVASHVPLVPAGVPCLFVIPGVDSLVYERQLAASAFPVRFLLRDLLGDAGKLAAYERDVLDRADGVLAISAQEQERIRALAVRPLPSLVLPPLFAPLDPHERAPEDASRTRLAFLGKLSWWPNREAIEWFLREVWPTVQRPGLELHLYGEGSEAFDHTAAEVHGHGFQESLEVLWRNTDVFINPMLTSTGVNVKVCEAIYQGLPVLTSPAGLRGLDFPPDPAVVACETPADWIDQLRNESLGVLRRRVPCESSRAYFELRRRVPQLRAFLDAIMMPAECLRAASSA